MPEPTKPATLHRVGPSALDERALPFNSLTPARETALVSLRSAFDFGESVNQGVVGLRTRMAISAAVLVVFGLAVAVPADALTSAQTKFVSATHRVAPSTKSASTKKLVALGSAVCGLLKYGSVADDVGVLDASSNTFHFSKNQATAVVATSVTYLCPSHANAVKAFEKHPSAPAAAAPTTTTTTAPPTAAFSCSGSAPEGVSITYGADTQNLDGGGSVPWSTSLPIPDQAQYEAVNAQLQGPDGSISCTVTVTQNGQSTTQMGEASGNYNIAAAQVCSGGDGTWSKC